MSLLQTIIGQLSGIGPKYAAMGMQAAAQKSAAEQGRQDVLDKERRTLETKVWSDAYKQAEEAGGDAVSQLIQSGKTPEWFPTAPWAAKAGIDTPQEIQARTNAANLQKIAAGAMAAFAGKPLMKESTIPRMPIQETSLYESPQIKGGTSTIPSNLPPGVIKEPVFDPRVKFSIGPSGTTASIEPRKEDEPVALQLDKMEWLDENGVIWQQKANYDKEAGTLTPLKGSVPEKSPKNTQKTPSVTPIGADQEGKAVFASTQRNADGSVAVTYQDGTPFTGKLAPLKEARLSPDAQKFIDDLGDIDENVTGIKDFMSLIDGPNGRLVLKKGKKGKVTMDKALTGPFQGRFRNFMSWFRNDPRFVRFKQKTARLRAIVYGLSGKQINRTELEWLKNEILPRFAQPDENYLAVLDEVAKWVKQKRSRSMKSYEAMGYIIGGEPDEDLEGNVGDLLGVETDDLAQFFTQ